MRTKAALLRESNTPWQIEEVELGDPKAHEIKIRMEAASVTGLEIWWMSYVE